LLIVGNNIEIGGKLINTGNIRLYDSRLNSNGGLENKAGALIIGAGMLGPTPLLINEGAITASIRFSCNRNS
jgi:hypothetical protein